MFLKKTTAFLKNAEAFGVKRPVVFLKRRGAGVIVKIFLLSRFSTKRRVLPIICHSDDRREEESR